MGISGYKGEMLVPQIIMVEDTNRGRLMQSLKSVLTSDFKSTEVFGKEYTLEDLLTILLTEIKRRADKLSGEDIKSVVLGRPVKYVGRDNEALALQRMTDIAKRAGFEQIEFEMEPIGAALSYDPKGTVSTSLVFDFGGGTLDVSVVRFPEKKILSVAGASIGGDLIDSEITKNRVLKYFGRDVRIGINSLDFPSHILVALENWYSISLLKTKQFMDSLEHLRNHASDSRPVEALEDLIKYNLGFLLFEEVDRVKIELTTKERTILNFLQKRIDIREDISRLDFEEMIHKLISSCENTIDEALNKASVKASDIERVITTGGSSLIPAVREMLSLKFGLGKLTQIDVFSSVAYGLGVRAGQVFDNP